MRWIEIKGDGRTDELRDGRDCSNYPLYRGNIILKILIGQLRQSFFFLIGRSFTNTGMFV